MQDIEGVILAGGRATRMQGRDKGLVTLNAMPLYQQVLQRLAPRCPGSSSAPIEISRPTGKAAAKCSATAWRTFLAPWPAC